MSNIEFLTDAQSEMVAGGAYLGTSANWVALSNIGAATAVGGSPQTLLGVGGGGARDCGLLLLRLAPQVVDRLLLLFGRCGCC